MKRLLIVIAVFILAACQATAPTSIPRQDYPVMAAKPVAPMPAPAPKAMPSIPTTSPFMVLVREYLYPHNSLDNLPVNLFLFPKKPTTDKAKEKLLFLCEEWKASFLTIKEVKVKPADTQWVPFFWMLKKNVPNEDCKTLVENYDYARSQLYTSSLKLDITKPYIVLNHENGLVSMDLTHVNKLDDITLAVDTWKKKMTILPKGTTRISIVDLAYSTKAVLGALSVFVSLKL